MFESIIKRDGRKVPYDVSKIERAITRAMESCNRRDDEEVKRLAKLAEQQLAEKFQNANPSVEDIQDVVENVLMTNGYAWVAKKYIVYRAERTKVREMNSKLMKIYDELTFTDAGDSDMKRDNVLLLDLLLIKMVSPII